MKFRQQCQQDGLPMYMAVFDPQGDNRTWLCGQMGCKGSRTTAGPLQASAAKS
jgi:hypothetical protein